MSGSPNAASDTVVHFGANNARIPARKRRGDAALGTFKFRTADGWLLVQQDGEDGNPKWSPVCSPIKSLALTRDCKGKNWGVYLEVTDPDGLAHRIAIPAALLVGSRGDPVFEILAGLGCRVDPSPSARKALLRFLNSVTDLDNGKLSRAIGAFRTGWHGSAFVLPERAIGGSDMVVYQSTSEIRASIGESGTLCDWRTAVAGPAGGNARVMLGIAAAFASALLVPLRYQEGFGIHLRGGSSSGKTTALVVAGSVWGGGGLSGYKQSWQATANGIEAMAEAHNDLLLTLDELGQVNPEDASRVAYQLASGVGRQRALQNGMGASRREWLLIFLSTGEISLADKLRDGKTPQRVMAGQEVRFIDLPADAGTGFGLFDLAPPIPGNPDASPNERGAAFSNALTGAAQRYYGTAGPAFLEAFVKDRESCIEQVRSRMRDLVPKLAPPDADGQVQRVAAHLSLIAAAGELAIAFGVLPWPRGASILAVENCFKAWLNNRGTSGAAEVEDAISHLRAVIERDGSARFQRFGSTDIVANRLGFFRVLEDGDAEYLIMPEAWKTLMSGRDATRTARDLVGRGILRAGENGRSQRKERVAGYPNPQRLYVVSAAALNNDGGSDGHTRSPAQVQPEFK